jgi:hypothetical protein
MTQDSHLHAALRSALPPVGTTGPSRDLWPRLVARSQASRTWPWIDIGLAAAAAVTLLLRPDLFVLLAYHF